MVAQMIMISRVTAGQVQLARRKLISPSQFPSASTCDATISTGRNPMGNTTREMGYCADASELDEKSWLTDTAIEVHTQC